MARKTTTNDTVITNALIPLDQLRPHDRNYNTHPPEQIQKIAESLRTFGQPRSIVVKASSDGYTIIAGHGVTEAARSEGWEALRADILPADYSEEKAIAYLVADNELSNGSDPDMAALAQLLEESKHVGITLEAMGFSDTALDALLADLADEALAQGGRDAADPDGGGDDFDVTPDETQTRVQRGDIWQLGEHRLMVDDATIADNVIRLMDGKKAVLMATDPPYGDSWVQKAKDMQAHGYGHSHAVLHGSIENDDRTGDDLKGFLDAFLASAKYAGDPPMPTYVWHRAKRMLFEQAMLDAGYLVHQPVVWVKPGFVIGRLHYHPRCEWALHGWIQGNGKCPFYGERNQSDIWEVGRENDKLHPTQKPLQLFITPIENHTLVGEICYEPFAGSGTQYIAAERTGRRCYGFELKEVYADVILTRWEKETGQTATLLYRLTETE